MPQVSGAQIRKNYNANPDSIVKNFTKALKEFGYEGLTEDMVRTACDNAKAKEKPQDVIGMFVSGWFEDGVID